MAEWREYLGDKEFYKKIIAIGHCEIFSVNVGLP